MGARTRAPIVFCNEIKGKNLKHGGKEGAQDFKFKILNLKFKISDFSLSSVFQVCLWF